MSAFKRILIGTDFTDCSRKAIARAVHGLANEPGTVVRVVHVLQGEIPNPLYAHYQGPDPEQKEQARVDALAMMQKLVPDSLGDGIEIEYVTPEGDPVVEMLNQAKEFQADVVVLGTEGRTGLRGLLMSSVAEHVVRESVNGSMGRSLTYWNPSPVSRRHYSLDPV
ncbi:MAG: universal stress protein, partial [Myxococcota bacterium]